MLALMLFTSRFHVDVVNATYERSRWALFVSMSLLVLHYVLQMVCGFRAESDDVGTIVNILFYSPVTFLVAHSILKYRMQPSATLAVRCRLYGDIFRYFGRIHRRIDGTRHLLVYLLYQVDYARALLISYGEQHIRADVRNTSQSRAR